MQVVCRGKAVIRRGGPIGHAFTIRPEDLDWHEAGMMVLEGTVRIEHVAYFTHPELGYLSWTAWESPQGVEAEKETDVGDNFLAEDFEFGLEYSDEEVAERQAMVDEAVTWFRARYEDPAMRTGYDSGEGGYLWDHGGPYDARDEIADAFDLPEELLDAAVREVESGGTYEWAAGDWWEEQDGGPDDHEGDGIFSIDEPLPDISDFSFELLEANEEGGEFGPEPTPADAKRDAMVAAIIGWFSERYEDPSVRTSYNTREGGYLWNHGGPFDAREELEKHIRIPPDVLDRAVAEIERDGVHEWAGREGFDADDEGILIDPTLPDILKWEFDEREASNQSAEGQAGDGLNIPEQGAGLAFVVSEGLIELDARGLFEDDELAQTAALRAILESAADDLLSTLAGSNAFAFLSGITRQYRAGLSTAPLAIDLVYALGVRLENARDRLRAMIDTGDYPEMGWVAGEALDSVLAIHGPLILSTARGRYLVELSQQYSRTELEIVAYREVARGIAQAAINAPNLVGREAAEALVAATNDIGVGPHPERSLQVAHSGNRNLIITIAGAVALWVLKEPIAVGVAASIPGVSLSEVTRMVANASWAFLETNAPILKQFAAIAGPDMGWLSALLRRIDRGPPAAPKTESLDVYSQYMLGWSELEGILRELAQRHGLTPERTSAAGIVSQLRSLAVIDQPTATDLTMLRDVRNRVAHGQHANLDAPQMITFAGSLQQTTRRLMTLLS